ncbi:uncharacterized protein LOC142239176 [Haematobia irritans]|uniref:uncharacterized protein LOC142239176 n=1 Tax=Haematobia irritans TaxID=7368 RepID=UPI003F4F9E52
MCDRRDVGLTEFRENYARPKLKKPIATRSRRYEQFLWQEIYDEYIRNNQQSTDDKNEEATTEYFDEFCKNIPAQDAEVKEASINRYPLYATTAISLWNHKGDKDFKKCYSITRPVQENTEQFG